MQMFLQIFLPLGSDLTSKIPATMFSSDNCLMEYENSTLLSKAISICSQSIRDIQAADL